MIIPRPAAILIALALFGSAESLHADGGFYLSVAHQGKRSFYMSIGAHFKASEKDVAFACRNRIPDDEMPVVFFLAAKAKVAPRAIVGMRVAKKSWAQITVSLGLGADIFHVPVKTIPGPPYGNAWGHFKKHPRAAWKKIVLPDRDIATLVNVRFISARHGFSPDVVLKARGAKKTFLSLHVNFAEKAKRRKAAAKLRGKHPGRAAKPHGKPGRGPKGGKRGGGGRKGGKGRK